MPPENSVSIFDLRSSIVVTFTIAAYPVCSHDIASWSDIAPCNKIDKPLVVRDCYMIVINITDPVQTAS